MLQRSRRSRIYFGRNFFPYPIGITLSVAWRLGLVNTALIGLSYIKAQLFPRRDETYLDAFFINRFGERLYETFFRGYTEKVWGVPCSEIRADWGAQRIKGLSVSRALAHAVRSMLPSRGGGDMVTGLLTGTVPVDALLAAFAEPAGEGPVGRLRPMIDRHFAADTVEDILARLDAGDAAAQALATAIRGKAPLSLKIALAQIRRGPHWSFDDCMRAEFRIVSRVVRGEDFYEGVRAVIVDKDNAPHWRPASLSDVSAADVERHFAPLERELDLP